MKNTDRDPREQARLYSVSVEANPHVLARLQARQCNVPWQHTIQLADSLERLGSSFLTFLQGDDGLWEEIESSWICAKRSFEVCGSPIEELYLASLVTFHHDFFDWDEHCGLWRKAGVKIRQQHVVENYRIDFAFLPAGEQVGLAVELDGHDFHERTKQQASRDKARDRRLQELGWRVFRFTGSDVWQDPMKAVNDTYRMVCPKVT